MHPDYSDSSLRGFPNDVAVLKFSAQSTNANFSPITLASSSDGTFAGQSCVITGWGLDETDTLPRTLQMASMTVMTNSACAGVWGTVSINDGHICITDSDSSSCNGDSGGPLVCSGKLAGATSWGASGCSPSYPSVYTRISYFRDWILQQ
jgi:secreted trypsin-like serine protease